MRLTLKVILCSIGVLFVALQASAQNPEPSKQQQAPPQLQPVFGDDFSKDTRSDYKINGDVSWELGKLTLAKGASIERPIDGGPWAKIELDLQHNPLTTEQPKSELRVWFMLDGATPCYVRLRRQLEDGKTVGSVALVDTGEKDGKSIEQVVRTVNVRDATFGSVGVEYRCGLVRITPLGAQILAAYVNSGSATVGTVIVKSDSNSIGVKHYSTAATRANDREFTKSEQEELAKANVANRELAAAYSKGQYAAAVEYAERVVAIRKSVLGEQHPDYAKSLNNLAAIYDFMSNYTRSEPFHRRALEINKSILGDLHPSYATSLNNLAMWYLDMGDSARAAPLFRQVLNIDKAVFGKQHPRYAASLDNLGDLYRSMSDFTQAESFYNQARDMRKSVLGEQHLDYAASLNNLAGLYYRMNDSARAESPYTQALMIRKTILGVQHPSYAISLNNLGSVYFRLGDFARAESLYRQASVIWKAVLGEQHRLYNQSIYNLALLYGNMGDSVRAESFCKQALQNERSRLDANALVQSARQQDCNQASVRFFLDTRLSFTVEMESMSNKSLEDLWQWKGAVTTRQQAYRQVAANPQLAQLFADLQSASRRLSVVIGQKPVPPPKTAPEASKTVFEQKHKAWSDRFAKLSRKREDLEQQIAAGSEKFRRIREPLTVANVEEWLPAGTALVDLLEYNHGTPNAQQKGKPNYERRYIAFVVRPDQEPAMIGLGSAESLAESVTAFRHPFAYDEDTIQNRGVAGKAAQQIRRELWLPIEAHLDGIDTVIISPDTALGTLPFGALPGKKDGSYLLEDYRIAMLPMANLLPAMMKEKPTESGNGLLLVGNVDYNARPAAAPSTVKPPQLLANTRGLRGGQGKWASLTGFQEELESVRRQYQQVFGDSASVLSLSGKDATERTLLERADQYNTLHVITHGYFENSAFKSNSQANIQRDTLSSKAKGPDPFINTYLPGLLSGLIMAGANNPSDDPNDPHDGILRASEIEASSMQGVDLVVLSACETGLGAVAGGEGMTGLQRAFHVAGARSVIASLWKVDDKATQELMKQFYTNLWDKKMSKIDALREAQLWMLRHPDELNRLGIKGATRGKPRKLANKQKEGDVLDQSDKTDPFFWAAFQLSGDWR